MKYTPTIVPSELDKAWLAGFMDGEGSISIARYGGAHEFYRAAVDINQAIPDPLEWTALRWGGNIVYSDAPLNTLSRRGIWSLTIRKQALVRVVLTDVLPYLKVKRLLAENVLSMKLDRQPGSHPRSADELDLARLAHQRGKALNGRSSA